MNKYKIRFDDQHINDTLKQYELAVTFGRKFVRVACATGLAVALLSLPIMFPRPRGILVAATLLVSVLLLLAIEPRLERRSRQRIYRSLLIFGLEIGITASESGVQLGWANDSRLAWATIERAIQLQDGFLVWYSPKTPYWWPNGA